MKKCIFCGSDRERAKEHIWPRWLQKKIGGSTKGQFKGIHLRMGVPISERRSSGEKLVLGNVCKECNNGWMERLESDFQPILDTILSKPKRLILKGKELSNISKWAFKTACVINKASNFHPIIPDNHLESFYISGFPPSNVVIEVSKLSDSVPEELNWIQTKIGLVLNASKNKSNYYDYTQKSYVIALQLKAFLIKIAYWPLGIGHFQRTAENKDRTKRIWPTCSKINYKKIKCFDGFSSFSASTIVKVDDD